VLGRQKFLDEDADRDERKRAEALDGQQKKEKLSAPIIRVGARQGRAPQEARLRPNERARIAFGHDDTVAAEALAAKRFFTSAILIALWRVRLICFPLPWIMIRMTIKIGNGSWRMAKNIIYFDLETQKSADEVGGWDKINRMGMSVGVTFSTARGDYRIYREQQVNDLLTELQRADLVVGFNVLRFDYEVLHGYTIFDLRQLPTLDMMVSMAEALQHRLSLDAIASATFGVEKTAEGMQAIRWFKEGKLVEIAEYCCYDVKLTKMVHEHGLRHRLLHYSNRFGKKMTVPVKWEI
jgi:DEAD/DEAH box helicase domain-containing protein